MNKQILRIRPVILLLIFSLSACAPAVPEDSGTAAPWTRRFDEQAFVKRAEDYVTEFQNGKFGLFLIDAADELAHRYPEETLGGLWTSYLNSARAFRRQETPEVSYDSGRCRVDVHSVHARYQIHSTFIFDEEETISDASFSLEPLTVKPESGDTWHETAISLGYDKEKPLNGMLTLPDDVEKPPVLILLQGSGKNNMDSLIGASDNRFFADLAHGLAGLGVASIRYDKRSYAYPEDVTDIGTEYLYDVKDAVRFAREDERVDGNRLYLAGHSQGGMLSPKIVSDNPEFKGFISMGGTLRRMEDLILEQNKVMNAGNEELSSDEKEAADAEIADLVAKIKGLDAEEDASSGVLLYGYPETYWKSLNEIDSLGLAEKLASEEFPMLILQGINDFQVTYDTDYALWQETTAENPNAVCIAYEGLSHVFMPGSMEFERTVYDPPAHVDAAVIRDIADWVNRQD